MTKNDEAKALAWKAFVETIAPALKAFNEGTAGEAYVEATVSAWKAYKELREEVKA